MIKRVFLSLIIFSICVIPADAGTVYYVTKSGSDSYNGRSWSAAWETLDKVNNMVQPGDTVFFGTGIWYNSMINPPPGGDANNVTVYACSTFSEASRGLAKIYGGDLLTGWSVYSGNIYKKIWDGPRTYVLGQNNRLLIPVSSAGSITQPGQFHFDEGSQTVYAWLYGSANPNNETMIIARKQAVVFNQENTDYIRIWGLALGYGKPEVISYAAKCKYTSIEHCDIYCGGYETDGNGGGILYYAYDGGKNAADSSTYGRYNKVIACTIGNLMEERGSAYSHGIATYCEQYVLIESCYVYPPIGNGIYFKDRLESQTHIGNVAKFNTIYGTQQSAIMWTAHAYQDSAYGNFIYDCHIGIMNWGSATPPFEGHMFIANNTIYNVECKGIALIENESGDCGDNNIVKYNIVAGTDLSGCDEDQEIVGFEYVSPPCYESYTIDSNMYYDVTDNFPCASGNEFSIWQGSCGYDEHGFFGTNPGFVDPGSGDFSRPGASPEMNRADYGDRQWTLWGAWQPSGDCPTPNAPSLVSPSNGATGLSQPVNLDWSNVSGATLYQVQVDDNASFGSPEINAQPVSSSYGASGLDEQTTYYWRARAYNSCGWGTWSLIRIFTVEEGGCPLPPPPTLASPANGASDLVQPINLDWYDVSGVTLYQVQVDNNPDFSNPEIDIQPSSSGYTASGLAEGTTYYWRARAYNSCGWGNWSDTRNLTTEEGGCPPPSSPILDIPADGASNLSVPVLLDWYDVSGASLYQVQVDDNSDFSSPRISVQPSSSSYSAYGLDSGMMFYWRVRAYNECGWGSWGPVRSFTIEGDCNPPQPPAYQSPPNGLSNVAQPVPLNWSDATGATKYQLQVDENSGFMNPEVDVEPVESQYSVDGLMPLTYYYWRVRSYNSCGWGSWTSIRYFVTDSHGGSDNTPPVISNVYADDTTSTTATVHWTTDELATSRVFYAGGLSSGDTTDINENYVYTHTVIVTGLLPDTYYDYRVISHDPAGNESISGYYMFKTGGFGLDADGDGLVSIPEPVYHTSQPVLVIRNLDTKPDNMYYFEVATDSNFINTVASSMPVQQQFGETTAWKVSQRLAQGSTYYWRASANLKEYSRMLTFEVIASPHPYPNPFDANVTPYVTFTEIPPGSNLIITTINGEIVKGWSDVGQEDIIWDGFNDHGEAVSPGVYLWYVESTDFKGKLTVIR